MKAPAIQCKNDNIPPKERYNKDSLKDDIREYKLLNLVEEGDVSVRLRNSIVGAEAAGSLPFETIGDYVNAGSNAHTILVRSVQNFGRKSARELEELVGAIIRNDDQPKSKIQPRNFPTSERAAILELLGDQTVAKIARDELFSARLANILNLPPIANMRFADFIDQFPSSIATMLRQPNCGRKSADEFRQFCRQFISMRLLQAGYCNPDPIAAWMIGGPPPDSALSFARATSGGNKAGVKRTDPFAPPQHESLVDRLEWLLSELKLREQKILRRRNGIGQERCETLEEIGTDLSVTRERIRQIEAKSLERIRVRVRRAPIAKLIQAEGPKVWKTLSLGAQFLTKKELYERRLTLLPHVRLALDIEARSIESLLDQVAHPMPHGWLTRDVNSADVFAAAESLSIASKGLLPQALSALVGENGVPAARLAAILIQDQPVCQDYFMPPRVGARLTRLVRLHTLLASNIETLQLEQLVQRYRSVFKDDRCSERDAEIVMDAAPHLFLEIEEGSWSALGQAGAPPPPLVEAETPIAPRPEESGTIAFALQSTLVQRGPTRLIDLLDDATEILPDGRSVNSIGPILLTRRELFVRVLPGVYALPEHNLENTEAAAETRSVIYNDVQARLYTISRYAGEPRHIFPFWSDAFEFGICRWAQHSGGPGILESLLAIAVIDDWPIEQNAREEWYHQQQKEGRYELGVSLRHAAAYELPGLDRVFAACRLAASTGHFNWVAGNRLTGRKIDSHGGAGLVALLLRLGAVDEITCDGYRWQRPHRTTPVAAVIADRLEEAFCREGADADWTSSIGCELIEQLVQTVVDDDWVDDAAFSAMFSHPPVKAYTDVEDDDPLTLLLAEQRRAREAERREATLDWLLGE